MTKSLYRTLYDAFVYTHKELRERINESGVSSRKKIKNLNLEELTDLADAFDINSEEMLEILLFGGPR